MTYVPVYSEFYLTVKDYVEHDISAELAWNKLSDKEKQLDTSELLEVLLDKMLQKKSFIWDDERNGAFHIITLI